MARRCRSMYSCDAKVVTRADSLAENIYIGTALRGEPMDISSYQGLLGQTFLPRGELVSQALVQCIVVIPRNCIAATQPMLWPFPNELRIITHDDV